jgi:Uma2 family endonuclease
MASDPRQRLTIEEYLAFERQSETKHDYFDGELFDMTGTSRKHSLISGNIFREIGNQIRGRRDCEVHSDSMRVRTPGDLFTYPDVVVACGQPNFDDAEFDTLLDPTVIVEVLSPSTAGYDRGIKSISYRSISSLAEYVLVAQDRIHIEHLIRRPGEGWLLREMKDPKDVLDLQSIGCRISLKDIYERVFD